MAKQIFIDDGVTVLALPVAPSDLTITVVNGSVFPLPTGGDWFEVTLFKADRSADEIVHCTNRADDVLTVIRGQNGTTAQSWDVDDDAQATLTAGGVSQIIAQGRDLTTSLVSTNYLPVKNSDGVFVNSRIRDTGSTIFFGIGSTTTYAQLVDFTFTMTNPDNITRPVGGYFRIVADPLHTASNPTDHHGWDVVTTAASTVMGSNDNIFSGEHTAQWEGSTKINTIVGHYGQARITGTGGCAVAIGGQSWVQNVGTGPVDTAIGHIIRAPTNNGAMTSRIGLKVEDQGSGANDYALWTLGTSKSVFGGAINATGAITGASFSANGTGNVVASGGTVWGKNFQAGATSQAAVSNFEFYTAAGYSRMIKILTAGVLNIAFGAADENAFSVYMYTNVGGFTDIAFSIARAAGGNFTTPRPLRVTNTTATTSTTTGSLVASGGIGAAGSIYCTGVSIVGGHLVLPKTSGYGIKVDTATPTFPWHDLTGSIRPDPAGANAPTQASISGGTVRGYFYTVNDKMDMEFHIPHDYLPGSDMFIHIHWLHNGTAISGTLAVNMTYQYAKGHNQAPFGTEKTVAVSYATVNIATTPRYQHRIDEVQLSTNGGSATQLDSATIEVDGIILVNMTVTGIPTITGGSPNEPCIAFVDLHYQSTGIGTKQKAPNFWT